MARIHRRVQHASPRSASFRYTIGMSIAVGRRRYLTNFQHHRLPHLFTDVLVLGSGIGGLQAALEAAEGGDVLVVTKDRADQSATAYAQGGIAAATLPEDDPEQHAADTLAVACGLGHPSVIREVAREAPETIAALRRAGARFDVVGEELETGGKGGTPTRGSFTPQTRLARRFCASCSSRRAGIRASAFSSSAFTLDLLTHEGRVSGSSRTIPSTGTRCSGHDGDPRDGRLRAGVP